MRELLICLLILNYSALSSQYDWPSLSPKGQISQTIGSTTISLSYERPSVRGRVIWGDLVPWNKVWRTGAGYCTTISFTTGVRVGGQDVSAGKYSLFTIPGKEEWVVILNRDTTLYGSYDYDSALDVARFSTLPTVSSRYYETLTVDIDVIPNNGRVFLSWGDTSMSFDIETDTDYEVHQYIKQLLNTDEIQDPDEYSMAADYIYYQNGNYQDALKLVAKSIAIADSGWNRNININIYQRLRQYDNAINEVIRAIEYERNRHYDNEEDREVEINNWKNRLQLLEHLASTKH